MKRLGLLISHVRLVTGNNVSDSLGDDEMAVFFNDAQRRLQSSIVQAHSSVFAKEGFIDSAVNQKVYDLPTDIFGTNRVISVEKTEQSTNVTDAAYYPLDKITPIERQRLGSGYFMRGSQLVISFLPYQAITNGFRLNYKPINLVPNPCP